MKKKQNNISFIDKVNLLWLTFKKDFARIYRNNYDKQLQRKIRKLYYKQQAHFTKWDLIYDKHLKHYQKYISYLQYKQLHKK